MADQLGISIAGWPVAEALAMPVRTAVFVAEQGVPLELERDDYDAVSRHALAWYGDCVIGTGRLLPDGHIGRMAVLASHRSQGVGSAILHGLMTEAKSLGIRRLQLHAQATAVNFYRRHGFVAQGGQFVEAGIVHVIMSRSTPD